MPSAVDVANLALDRLGQPPISSFDDGTTVSNLCNRMYPFARNKVQRAVPWRRQKARTTLAADVSAPAWGYTYKYRLPSDCVRLLDVYKSGYPLNTGWEVEGDFILSDEVGPLQIRYSALETNPDMWDELMVSATASLLAYEMAESLTQDATKKAQALQYYMEDMKLARHANGQEGNPVRLTSPDEWERVRWSGGSDIVSRDITEV